jgi:hypothetical protein
MTFYLVASNFNGLKQQFSLFDVSKVSWIVFLLVSLGDSQFSQIVAGTAHEYPV